VCACSNIPIRAEARMCVPAATHQSGQRRPMPSGTDVAFQECKRHGGLHMLRGVVRALPEPLALLCVHPGPCMPWRGSHTQTEGELCVSREPYGGSLARLCAAFVCRVDIRCVLG